jgi:hypothetical protein
MHLFHIQADAAYLFPDKRLPGCTEQYACQGHYRNENNQKDDQRELTVQLPSRHDLQDPFHALLTGPVLSF